MPSTTVFDTGTSLAALCKALGNPVRLAIMRFLMAQQGGSTCGEIVRQLPLAQSTVSQHLGVLKQTGWILGEARSARVTYRVNAATVEEFRRLVAAL